MSERVMLGVVLAGAVLLTGSWASAQDAPPAPAPQVESDDVVVTGLRDLDDPKLPVSDRSFNRTAGQNRLFESEEVYGFSERFARCAMNRAPANLAALRRVLDTRINSSLQSYAQRRLVRSHVTCTEDPNHVLQFEGNAAVSDHYDTSYYDRGALFQEAIRAFAPNLRLTKAETHDPAVQGRFNSRENALAKFRLKIDSTYFETAICLVREQPEIAVRLVKSNGPDRTLRALEASLVNNALVCVGNARRVYFDPSQFRFYIAEALYRWAVAAKGVDSLIPAG